MIILTDGYVANGAEPWLLPDLDALPDISVPFAEEPNHGDDFWPYLRDPETLARPWAIPGTPGLMHRIGGIEKEDGTGNINYDPENHDFMVRIRAEQGRRHRERHPAGRRRHARATPTCSCSAGGARGARSARRCAGSAPPGRRSPTRTSCTSTRSPPTSARCWARYSKVLVPEMNLGQLSRLVRAEFLVDAVSLTQVRGVPFTAAEIEAKILEMLG